MITPATATERARARAAGLARMRADQSLKLAARTLLQDALPEGGPPIPRAHLYREARARGIPRDVLDALAGRERLRTGRLCRERSQAIYWQRLGPEPARGTRAVVPWHRCGCGRRWRPTADVWSALMLGDRHGLVCPSCEGGTGSGAS